MPSVMKIVACLCFVLATVKLLNMVNLLSAGDADRDLIRHQALYTSVVFGSGIWFWIRGNRKVTRQ